MILTGSEIEREWAKGRITIDPFVQKQLNPNSYNFRLGRTLRIYREKLLDTRTGNEFDEIEIPEDGYVLEPGRLYLAHTVEILGSDHYAPTFAARSSVARLGLFINLSASLGDIGYKGQWTLQLYAINRIRVYPEVSIGQMMWWQPQGDVQLYDGKYQGASGPRSSDIHRDFHKQFARQRFPGLRASPDASSTGHKFAALAECSHDFPVPDAFCVPAGEFVGALTEEQRAALTEVFEDLRGTVGAFFTDALERIGEIMSGLRLSQEIRTMLRLRLEDMFEDSDALEFAVRSSGLDEDTAGSSLAGVHRSVLEVRGADAVADAVEQCWRSYYEAPAVAARVRAGDYAPLPRLAVIVQLLVRPELAGVAFSEPGGGAVVEYVTGLADELVAGVAAPVRLTSRELAGAAPAERAHLDRVVEMVAALRERYEHEVDVEWAADEHVVHLIQVRPQTAAADPSLSDAAARADCYRLYFDDLPPAVHLGEVAGVYGSYVAKRAPAHRMAAELGVSVGSGWVLHFNGRGLHDPDTAGRLRRILSEGRAEECVLDFGDTLRQIVVPKRDLIDRLVQTTGAGPESETLHAVVSRDFIRGDLGVLSHRVGDDLVIEYAAEGLMALNRGTAGAESVVVREVPVSSAPSEICAPLRPHLAQIFAFTDAMRDRYGSCAVEWVHHDGRLYFVDYSVLGTDNVSTAADALEISRGTAAGPLMHLRDDDLLARLSIGPAVSVDKSADVSEHEGLARILARVKDSPEKPIIRVARPYAVLSVLIGHVAGFAFDRGSTLGHLAILLREAGVPAITAAGLPSEGQAVISDGTITLSGRTQVHAR